MTSWARPGVKCVCLYGQWALDGTGPIVPGPKEGGIYTVASWPIADKRGDWGFRLVGWDGADDVFLASCFRPLITQEQDVAKFRHLLTPSPVDAGLVPSGVELDA
jgi:hypothetical protein